MNASIYSDKSNAAAILKAPHPFPDVLERLMRRLATSDLTENARECVIEEARDLTPEKPNVYEICDNQELIFYCVGATALSAAKEWANELWQEGEDEWSIFAVNVFDNDDQDGIGVEDLRLKQDKEEIDAMSVRKLRRVSGVCLFALNRLAKHQDTMDQANITKKEIYAAKDAYLMERVRAGEYERVERFSREGERAYHDCQCGHSWVGFLENNYCRDCEDDESVESSPKEDTFYVVDLGKGQRYHRPRGCLELDEVSVEVTPHDPEQPAREIPQLSGDADLSVRGQIYALERYVELLKTKLLVKAKRAKATIKPRKSRTGT